MKEIPKRYDPNLYEEKLAKRWVKDKTFGSVPDDREPYSIVIPPPNVTGVLHMGHALNNALQDIIIRVNRIRNMNSMWMPGTDHGGIATQNVVEKMLLAEGKTRHDLGREEFLQRMWRWKDEAGGTIISQLKRIGCGCDWDRLRFTMDEQCSTSVKEAFVRLYEKGLIYRGYRMTNWCPRCQTALADIEVEHEEKQSKLWYINYPFEDGGGHVTVATTRPETMLGDTAVAVNPEDKRYSDYIGKKVKLPLTPYTIDIIADQFVDMDFGTGCVKVTPAHDPNDNEIGQRHSLESRVVIDREGKMTPAAGRSYEGLDRFECREKVVKGLQTSGALEKIEDYSNAVGICYRCSTVIEPLDSIQWFMSMKDMASKAAAATGDGRVTFYPSSWSRPYLNWLDNIRDWCLSRQIWWGHRIPIWYCCKCDAQNIRIGFNKTFHNANPEVEREVQTYGALAMQFGHDSIVENADTISISSEAQPIVGTRAPSSCPSCGAEDLIQDPDVLDTWFSSALWPFSTLGWPRESNSDLEYYYPTDVLVTGHEILYLWVARMVMMGLEMIGDVPFKSVYIHGIIRDEHGNKMSKSKGNVIDPLQIIDEYGTDSLRFALAKSAVPGRDIQLSDDDFVGARNFCNKLWNATRLILSNITVKNIGGIDDGSLELADKWILYQLQSFSSNIEKGYEGFNNAYAARQIYEFTWKYFCDWYLELAKIRLYSEPEKSRQVQKVLLYVLTRILNMITPIMPFISSQLWEYLAEEVELPSQDVMGYNGFKEDSLDIEETEIQKMNTLMAVISEIRNIRGENGIQPSVRIEARIKASGMELGLLTQYSHYLEVLGGVGELMIGEDIQKQPGDTMAVAGNISVFVKLPEQLVEQEIQRLEKKMLSLKMQSENANKKLRNRDFVEKAPPAVVESAKKRAEELQFEYDKIENNLSEIQNGKNNSRSVPDTDKAKRHQN